MAFNKIGELARKNVGAAILWTALTIWGTSVAVNKAINIHTAEVKQNEIEENNKVLIADIIDKVSTDPTYAFRYC